MSASRLIIPVVGYPGAGSTSLLKCLSQSDWRLDEKNYAMTEAPTSIVWTEGDKEIIFRDIPVTMLRNKEVEREITSSPISVMVIDHSQPFIKQTSGLYLYHSLATSQRVYIVGTKSDSDVGTRSDSGDVEITPTELKKFASASDRFTYLGSCSAKTGDGIEECKAALSSAIRSSQALATVERIQPLIIQ